MNFKEKFLHIVKKNNSLLCIGLDIDKDKIPSYLFKKNKNPFFEFNKSIIDSTKNLVCAYKLNMAFYEVLGKQGFDLLEKTINYIPKDIIVILDGKRNDIGNTAKKYAKSLFEVLNADAVTVNPYLGKDGIMPFLEYKDKCSFILCRTSNPSAVDFQNLVVSNIPLYELVAKKIKQWNDFDNCGAVVGATYPDELKIIRKILGEEIPILIPGVGAQGGDVEKTVKYGTNKNGEMAIINSSRAIIYAANDESFSEKAKTQAQLLRNEINKYR
ncbi:MAG: orotidine-5'-phosphate decarboxylase [Candidatus Thermoplasmatota archaeon]|nr:orotidine-5'-phosphate decarboxylase [Candidatus Thermoplasmatota archaeon]